LAAHEGPWLWWDAIERLSSWSDFEGRHDSLPGDLKVRLFLVRGPHGFSNPEQIASPAHSLLAGLLTPQLRDHDLGTFYDVLRSIDKNLDRPDATAAMIAFLRRANVYDNSTAPATPQPEHRQARNRHYPANAKPRKPPLARNRRRGDQMVRNQEYPRSGLKRFAGRSLTVVFTGLCCLCG